MGSSDEKRFSPVATEAHPADLEPALPVVPPSQQGWQETLRDRSRLPRRTDALRGQIRPVLAVSWRHLSGIYCLLARWPVGELRFLSRRHSVAQQTGWQRPATINLSPD